MIAGNRFLKLSTRLESLPAFWVVILVSIVMIPPTFNEAVECKHMDGYNSGIQVPDTCTVQLALNDTESETIVALNNKFEDFPLRCRLRKYTVLYEHLCTFKPDETCCKIHYVTCRQTFRTC